MENQIEIYQSADGETQIEVKFEQDTVWLTQKMMANLFHTRVPNINMHLSNVFDDGELTEEATIKDFLIVQMEEKREVKRNQEYFK